MALRRFGYHLASQSRAATRSRVPTAMAKAHKFSASQVAVFPNVLKSQETIEPMIPGRAAAALPAKLTRARQRACRCFFFHPLFQTALVGWLGSRRRRTSPTTGERKQKCRDCHADGCENRCDGNSLLTKQGANALSQCGSHRRTDQDLFVGRRPVERFAVVINPELVIVDTIGEQPISTVYFLIKGINQALLLGHKFCLSNLTTQGLDIVPGCFKLLLDARREWVHNGVMEVKAIIIVYSRSVGVERGVFKIKVSHTK